MAQVAKWGNSLGLRVPAHVAQILQIRAGQEVHMRVQDNGTIRVALTAKASRATANQAYFDRDATGATNSQPKLERW